MSDSFFASVAQFPQIGGDCSLISTRHFLEASRGIVLFVEFLGKVFAPVRNDIQGNIDKLQAILEQDAIGHEHLNGILKAELQQPDPNQVLGVGTDALLWLTRALDYIKVRYQGAFPDNMLRFVYCLRCS